MKTDIGVRGVRERASEDREREKHPAIDTRTGMQNPFNNGIVCHFNENCEILRSM